MQNSVVVHFLNGRVVKGTSLDVDPMKPTCHIRPEGGKPEQVRLLDIKALFFVRSLQGDPAYQESREAAKDDTRLRGSYPITVKFRDGESIVGLTNRYPPNRPFFFIVPVDLKSNNIRILVNKAAVVDMSTEPTAPAQSH